MEIPWVKSVLDRYKISWTRGFLSDQDPLVQFEDPYFLIWDEIFGDITMLMQTRQLRETVDKMPLLDQTKLGSMEEWQRAYMVLSVIGCGYVWQNGENDAAKVVPKSVAVPWFAVAEYVGGNPVGCHCTYVLNNWKIIDKTRPLDLSNVDTLFSFTGDKSEHWFFMITLQIELDAAPGIRNAVIAQQAVRDDHPYQLEKSLISIKKSIDKMTVTLRRMYERCDPTFFYAKLRILLAGWKNNTALPDGLIYEGVSSEPFQFYGGSGAQSSVFQTFDALLGIARAKREDGRPSYLQSILEYMPRHHRDFISFLSMGPSIKKYVEKHLDDRLKATYNSCIDSLQQYRSFHIQMVCRYVTIQAAKKENGHVKTLAKKGTGGTDLMRFLKRVRSETTQSMIKTDQGE